MRALLFLTDARQPHELDVQAGQIPEIFRIPGLKDGRYVYRQLYLQPSPSGTLVYVENDPPRRNVH